VTRSIPLQRLKVHLPAVNCASNAARSQAPKNLARPSFAELSRAAPRLPSRGLTGAQQLIQGAQPLIDVAEPPDNKSSPSVIDTATASELDRDTHRLNELQTLVQLPSSKPRDASEIEAAQADPRGHLIVNYVAATISNFCNDKDVQATDGWTVRLLLDESILTATTVYLSLSLHWLLLRFDCGDPESRQVIAQHRGTLQTALEEAIVPRREVSIDID
jgi:Type III secretion protein (HpaP)